MHSCGGFCAAVVAFARLWWCVRGCGGFGGIGSLCPRFEARLWCHVVAGGREDPTVHRGGKIKRKGKVKKKKKN